MDKKLFVHLQGGRKVSGTLRGYDLFLNLVLDDALEESTPAQRHPIGTVVSIIAFILIVSELSDCRLFVETALLQWRPWRQYDDTSGL
jgi:small nuclear ribonucleoprotein (snRNP)-like protein